MESINALGRRTRWSLIAAIGPIAFGSTYWVTREFLPADSPLWGSALRALPAGLVLLLIVRRLPRGAWWWRAAVLGTLNMGLFFCLVYVAAQLLPSSVAASVTSISPLLIAGFAWLLVGERPTGRIILSALLGAAGVLLIVGTASERLDASGVVASFSAMALSSIGAILTRRWDDGTPVLTVTTWQLLIGGIELVLVAALVEGTPPTVDAAGVIAFAYISLIATALGFFCWFSGFRHLPAGAVGVIGLLNPVTGVALGVFLAGETLSLWQLCGIGVVLVSIVWATTGRRSAHAELRLQHGRGRSEQGEIRVVASDLDLQPLHDRGTEAGVHAADDTVRERTLDELCGAYDDDDVDVQHQHDRRQHLAEDTARGLEHLRTEGSDAVGQMRGTHDHVEAAPKTTRAGVPVRVHREVGDLPGGELLTERGGTTDEDRRTDAVVESDDDRVTPRPTGETTESESHQVHIVPGDRRQTCPLPERLGQGYVTPPQAVGDVHDSGFVEEAG